MNLTPQEAFQALIDGKKVAYRHPHLDWAILKPTRFKLSKLLDAGYQFRLQQEMITIGDVSFPKPESEPPEKGRMCYSPNLLACSLPICARWDGDRIDIRRLERGVVHLTEENAIAHAQALIKLSGGNVDE